MMEVKLSQTGFPILLVEGKPLVSQRDPLKEAKAWVDLHKTQFTAVNSVFVLGVGCGYHLVALQETFHGRIVAIESNLNFLSFAREHLSLNLTDVYLLPWVTWDSFRDDRKVREAIGGTYAVINHLPSQTTARAVYREIQDLLIGRTLDDFESLLSVRSDLNHNLSRKSLLNWRKCREFAAPDQRLSIRDLKEVFKSGSDKDISMVNLLMELVR